MSKEEAEDIQMEMIAVGRYGTMLVPLHTMNRTYTIAVRDYQENEYFRINSREEWENKKAIEIEKEKS